jgi:cell division protein FtsN
MADDDKDFTFGKVDDDFSSDDGWGSLNDDPGSAGADNDSDLAEAELVQPEEEPEVLPAARGNLPGSSSDGEPAETGHRRFPSRMIWYGLLVIVLSSGGFYYFTTSPLPPAAVQRPVPASQTVPMPERPEPVAEPDTPPGDPGESDSSVAGESAVPKGTLREVMPTETVPASLVVKTPATPAESVVTPPESVVAAPVVVTVEKPFSKPPAPVKKTAAKVKRPGAETYIIQAGAFADPLNRDEVLKKIGQLGFAAQVVPIKKVMPVTRLLLGVYAPEEAGKMATNLQATIPSVFTLRQGDQVAVYAGSFVLRDMAQELVGELSRKGIQVSEQQSDVELTLFRVTFGSFPDRATAATARARALAIGLESNIVRNR